MRFTLQLTASLYIAAANAACPVRTQTITSPVVAPGWDAKIASIGLKSPRGIIFDKLGQLIVVEQSHGLRVLKLNDLGGACFSTNTSTVLLADTSLNHGIELSPSGTTLYASSSGSMYAWDYDATKLTLANKRTIITGMDNPDHSTRTLLLSKAKPNLMLVSRGSNANLDYGTVDKASGRSMIKSFDISTGQTYDFTNDGSLVGWGLRNEVGVSEHPTTSGIWTVENSADNVERLGVDIHETNPGEKLNFLGYMNGNRHPNYGSNFGYPLCFAAWNASVFSTTPKNQYTANSIAVGQQFAMDPNVTYSDAFCQNSRTAPRLVFEPHTAPLDIKFTSDGNTAWITFHGSWDRSQPAGYKLSTLTFSNGEPTAPVTNPTPLVDILTNKDNSKCPGSCFRPAGLAIDSKGRVFMSSDATGEIWVVSTLSTGGSFAAVPSKASKLSSSTLALLVLSCIWLYVM